MLRSMTAYGRAHLSCKEGRFVAEIQSLNRKFLEIVVLLPKELSSLENEIRKWIASQVFRGKLVLKIGAAYDDKSPVCVSPNLALAKQLKTAWEKIGEVLNVEKQCISFELLNNDPDILLYTNEFDEESYKNSLKQVVNGAVQALIEMKVREGCELKKDFLQRIQKLKESLETVKSLAHACVQRFQDKLKRKIEEVLPGKIENEERILREVCLYAEKVDITEEITRLASHIKQFTAIVEEEKSEKGKTMDFLLQEMNREANTMGSKSDDVKLTSIVIDLKVEIEKMREQVQNVE